MQPMIEGDVQVGELTSENEVQSKFLRHVSTLAKESSSGMIRTITTLTGNEQYGNLHRRGRSPERETEFIYVL
jgi:hypothetical protein